MPHVIVSPLAELGAALHRLAAIDHVASRWTAKTWASMPASLRDECRLFSAIWGGYRSRFLLPITPATDASQTNWRELRRRRWTPSARAKAKGRLRGKKPKLNPKQEAHLVKLHDAGEHTTAELGELFGVARSTEYRTVKRAQASTRT